MTENTIPLLNGAINRMEYLLKVAKNALEMVKKS